MTERFRPASPLPSHRHAQASRPCKCCAAREQALALTLFDTLPECHSPLTPGVQAVNISRSKYDSTLQVTLGKEWPRMLAQLSATGEGLLMTRNEAAILGSRQSYPLLHFTAQNKIKAANAEAGLWIDQRGFGAAQAFHARQAGANLFGVEFTNIFGQGIHRFSLTPESDLDEFCGWVRLHQACGVNSSHANVPERSASEETETSSVQYGDAGAVFGVIQACVRHNIVLRVTVCAAAARQRAYLIAKSLQPMERWWFVSDDKVGLHFCSEHFSQVRILPELGEQFYAAPVLYADSADHSPALILEMGNPEQAVIWNAIVHELV